MEGTTKNHNDLLAEIEELKKVKEAINNSNYANLSKETIFLIHSKIEEIKYGLLKTISSL